MPHLHLPIDHTDADLVLAANLAEVVGSADLYVAWSHENGPGAVPEVEAVVREERPAHPFAELLVSLGTSVLALWHALVGRPADRGRQSPPPPGAPRRSTAEPSA
jgi:hypothetical protein